MSDTPLQVSPAAEVYIKTAERTPVRILDGEPIAGYFRRAFREH